MKKIMLYVACLGILLCDAKQPNIDSFLKTYPDDPYQDLIIGNETIRQGINICPPRYEMIKPILDHYDRPFRVLDLGAAQGYFSFKIAHDYPHAECVMIEANTSFYANHGDILYDLCLLNSHLNNIIYLNNAVTIADLDFLNKHEHFDVILAFLVIHQIAPQLHEQIKVVEKLLSLGDTVIIEAANDVAPLFAKYVNVLCKRMQCHYLGEIKRTYDSNAYGGGFKKGTGKFYCFKSKCSTTAIPKEGISQETFQHLNGVYPNQ